jgi:UDP-glucose 4-epimerase
MKKILVTGGAGFIASHLVDKLLENGYEVVVVDNLSTGSKKNLNKKAKLYKLDIQDKKLDKVFGKEKPEAVFHYAAQISVRESVKDPIADAKTNVLGSLNILENCKKYGVKKIIFSSSGGSIYGDTDIFPTNEECKESPLSPYAIAKLSIEKYLYYYYKFFNLDYVSLRFANIYGPRQNSKGEAGVIAIFSEKILSGIQPTINGSGLQTRDFVFVGDIVKASILALEKNEVGVFNLGTAQETNIKTIFKKINNILGNKFQESYGPSASGESERSCLDFSKVKKYLGWVPNYDLDKGLIETVNWFKQNR